MRKILTFLILLLLTACHKDENNESYISVSPGSITVLPESGNKSVTVSSTGPWTMSGNASWCTPSVTSGQNGDAVSFVIAANLTDGERSVTYTFTCGDKMATLTVTQEPGSSNIFVTPGSITVLPEGGNKSVTVSSAGPWTMSGNASWCIPSASSGQNGDAVSFVINQNSSNDKRSVTYTFTCGNKTATLIVSQEGKGSIDFGDYEEENWN